MVDCNFIAKTETVEEVMKQVGDHAKTAHGMTDEQLMTEENKAKTMTAIKDE